LSHRKLISKYMHIKQKIQYIFNFFGYDIRYYHPRPFMKFLGRRRGRDLVGAEVGVWQGKNAFNILKHLSIKKLYLIDPYKKYIGYDSDGTFIVTQKKLSIAKIKAHRRLSKFKNKIVWINEFSDTACNKIPEKLDFVYIDANHNYEFVKKDMENYYSLLKKGGILAGHDICLLERPGVLFALTDFIREKKLLYHIDLPDWIIVDTPNKFMKGIDILRK